MWSKAQHSLDLSEKLWRSDEILLFEWLLSSSNPELCGHILSYTSKPELCGHILSYTNMCIIYIYSCCLYMRWHAINEAERSEDEAREGPRRGCGRPCRLVTIDWTCHVHLCLQAFPVTYSLIKFLFILQVQIRFIISVTILPYPLK